MNALPTRKLLFFLSTALLLTLIALPVVHGGDTDPVSTPVPTEPLKIYSRKEAYRASTDRIVLHYGEGLDGVGQIAEILNERGYPTTALPGGPENGVRLFIDRGIGKETYNQDDVDDGTLGGHAMSVYRDRVGPPAPTHAISTP